MARPIKNTVDYFPHIIQNGKTIFILENKYGNDGYAFWFKLLELLGSSHDHVYDFNNLSDWEFLIAKTKVSEEKATEILKTLADVEAIDRELLGKKIIWCENFVKGIEDVYKKRRKNRPEKPVINNGNPKTTVVSDTKTPQSKVKEIKVNNIKEKKEREEVQKAISRSLNNKSGEEKKKANNIEFDQEILSWHGIDEDIYDDWIKRFPNIDVPVELIKIREYFKNNPGKAEEILKKFEGRMPIYINDWLERAEKYRIADSLK